MQRKRPFILIRTIPGALAELRSVRRMLREALTFQVKGTVWTKDTLVWRWMHSRSWQQSSVFIAEIGSSTQFSSVTSNSLWPHGLHCSTPGFPVYHQLLELAQTCVYWVGDAIQPSHPLLSPSPPAFSLSQHQGLFQWVSSSHQVAKVLEFQLQHQSFQWIFKTDFF